MTRKIKTSGYKQLISVQIIIIGGGPCGLAAAQALKKHHGIDVAVYEIRPEPATAGGAISIPPNGLRLFDRLGLLDRLAARGNGASQMVLHSLHDEILLEVDRSIPVQQKTGFGFIRVLRADIMSVLLDAAHEACIPICYGHVLKHVLESDTGVKVEFSDGTTDTADLLFGCDGIHSAVRKLHVCPETIPEYSGISNIYAVLPTAQLPPEASSLAPFHGTLTLEGILGVTACTASLDQLYWFYSREVPMPPGENARDGWSVLAAGEARGFTENILRVLQDGSGKWIDLLRTIVSTTATIRFYPIYKMATTDTWSTARCYLLGDAAHAMPPHIGQGVSMALEDIFCLSGLLQGQCSTMGELHQQYEAIRRPRVETLARESADTGKIRLNTSPLRLRMKETAISLGGWLYKTMDLQRWGFGTGGKAFTYDITKEVN